MRSNFQITLNLSEKEFLALARIGNKELRSPRNQAHLFIRDELIERGALTIEPSSELAGKVATR